MPKTNKKPDARTLRYALAQQEVNEASGQYFPKTTAELDVENVYSMDVDSATPNITINNNTSNTGTNIFPVNYGVHWIMKL